MGRPTSLGSSDPFDFLDDVIHEAERIGYKVKRYGKGIYVELTNLDDHLIHIGKEAKYFVATSLKGLPLWDKRKLGKSSVVKTVREALSGRDIGEYLRKELK